MAEKILNTRLQLKYDTWKAWNDASEPNKGANYILKKGEIGICAINEEYTENNPSKMSPPQILFKVGDGEHIFGQLRWASAMAADVNEWAKQLGITIDHESITTTSGTKTYTGNAVTEVEWDNSLNGGMGGLKFIRHTQFATKAELDAALDAFGGDLASITDTDTQYTFEIADSNDVNNKGKLKITSTKYTNGAAGTSTTEYIDLFTSDKFNELLPSLTIADKTESDTTNEVYAITNLVENNNDKYGITPTYTAVPTSAGVDSKLATQKTTYIDPITTDVEELKTKIGGLTGAMHFIGTSTSDPTSDAGPSIDGVTSFASGDVILYLQKEYVYNGTSWILLGDEGSYLTKTEAQGTYVTQGNFEQYQDYLSEGDITVAKATLADKATADSNGNNIANTYATKTSVNNVISGNNGASKNLVWKTDANGNPSWREDEDTKFSLGVNGVEISSSDSATLNDTSTISITDENEAITFDVKLSNTTDNIIKADENKGLYASISSNTTADSPSGLKVTTTAGNADIQFDDEVTFVFDCGNASDIPLSQT